MTLSLIHPQEIAKAHARIAPYINATPLLTNDMLNTRLGGIAHFKFEGFQKTGAFKFRGALNTLLSLKEEGLLPEHVVAYSSGNHAQAVAYAAKLLHIKATIFIPDFSSPYKIAATKSHGAEVILTKTRDESEQRATAAAAHGAFLIPPFDADRVICGQGTSAYEALKTGLKPDAIFATVGGGGWISGTYLATQLLSPESLVIGGEPLLANDATRSFRSGKIERCENPQATLADGARTPQVAERTFQYIQKLSDMIEIREEDMLDWTRELALHLKITAEPTSAVAAAAAAHWLKNNPGKTVLILLSGGNIDPTTHQKIWQ